MANLKLQIQNGPSHWDMIVSEHHGDSSNRNTVAFLVTDGANFVDLTVVINGNQREDGSGYNWFPNGYIISATPHGSSAGAGVNRLCARIRSDLRGKFKAFYELRKRTGYLEIEP